MELIDKSALVAEIEKRQRMLDLDSPLGRGGMVELQLLKDKLNTLEVKEVDLEHEVESYWKQCDMTWCRDAYSMTHIRSMLSDIVKHFFELGLQAQKGE